MYYLTTCTNQLYEVMLWVKQKPTEFQQQIPFTPREAAETVNVVMESGLLVHTAAPLAGDGADEAV